MARLRSIYRCDDCGATEPKWAGRCATCGAWNTLTEEVERPAALGARDAPVEAPVPIAEVGSHEFGARPTGVGELDRVLGGGLVPGSVTLLGGEPGIGKSTLLLQMLGEVAASGAPALLVSAEESKEQVRLRAERVGALRPKLWIVGGTSLPAILAALDDVSPQVAVIDSIQTVHDPEIGGVPGTVTQVRECAQRLVVEAKQRGVAIVLVGHVTKEGALAGPRLLEHVVDTVLAFEGDRHHALRVLRAAKHRFGSTQELGLFEMSDGGLDGVADPSRLFLGDRREGVAGSVVVPAVEGHRPLLLEVQALVAPTSLPQPRRTAKGIDGGRLALVLAVLQRRAGVSLGSADVWASVVGGVRLVEPAADLALALALASAAQDVPIAAEVIALGEIGLGGELRQVAHTPRRLAEAARLGFRHAVVPFSAPAGPPGLTLHRAATLAEALLVVRGLRQEGRGSMAS